MAENVTPVTLEVKDFAKRQVLMVDYQFDDGNSELLQWMIAPNDPRDFKITFFNTVDGSTMKELKGTGCYCIHYQEKWEDGQEHFEEMDIVCQKLENGSVPFDNPWA